MNIEKVKEFLEKHYMKNRATVTDESNEVIEDVVKRTGGKIINIPTGKECLNWIIPKKWTVHDAYIKDMTNNKIIVDFKDNPLHLWSYSDPVDKTINFNELEKHILYREKVPDRIPYHYALQYDYSLNGWGFSMTYGQYLSMDRKAEYKAFIDSEFTDGTMQIADTVIKGRHKATVFFGAHNCHPGQVNDGLLNIVILMDLFDFIKTMPKPNYTYRMIIGPEYFGGVAFLEHGENIKDLKYGLYLDMVANNKPVAFSRSYNSQSMIDKAVEIAVRTTVENYTVKPYREVWGNDELFYDGPDFLVPTVGLGRERYPEYHTSIDDISHVNWFQYGEMQEILKKIILYMENNCIPERRYIGPAYLSRYGIKMGGEFSDNMQVAQILMDGENSLIDISFKSKVPFEKLYEIVKELESNGLMENKPIWSMKYDIGI